MNGKIAIGLGIAALVWAAVTLFEGLLLGAGALGALGIVLIGWGLKQPGKR